MATRLDYPSLSTKKASVKLLVRMKVNSEASPPYCHSVAFLLIAGSKQFGIAKPLNSIHREVLPHIKLLKSILLLSKRRSNT